MSLSVFWSAEYVFARNKDVRQCIQAASEVLFIVDIHFVYRVTIV